MIILSIPESETKAKVVGSYLDSTVIANVEAQTLPDPTEQVGKNAILYINPQTKELFYEYEDRELTDDEKQEQSEQEQALMLLALVEGGLM